MGKKKGNEVITSEQIPFMKEIRDLWATAEEPDVAIDEAFASISAVAQMLDDVESGATKIVPPFSSQEFDSLREKSNLLVGIGQKAINALEVSEQGRAEAVATPEFKGNGAEAKR